jgi:hypothetical protein
MYDDQAEYMSDNIVVLIAWLIDEIAIANEHEIAMLPNFRYSSKLCCMFCSCGLGQGSVYYANCTFVQSKFQMQKVF